MKDLTKEIKAYALRNAIEYQKTSADKILPKLFQHGLKKEEIKEIMPEIAKIANEINAMDYEKRVEEYIKYGKYVKEKEEREGLPELDNVGDGKVVMRLAPEPSKYNHIGHALVFLIQYMYAKKYKGKCILRFDDTNPEKSTDEFYKANIDDLKWIGIKWDKEIFASDDNLKMYELAEKLIVGNNAYVCSCQQDEMRNLREKMKECSCRAKKSAENMAEWKKMLNREFKEGERTLRLKGNMKSNNGVMRDPVIFRISYAKHYRQGEKYCVWPMYDFENPIEDSLNGVTHVIRSKEFEMRNELHDSLLKLLKLKMPNIREIGRYQITGAETQGRVIREMIENKKVIGWDDPRLVTIKALRRRGFVPEMFQELAQTVGLSKSGGHIDPSVLAATNRKIIDKEALRFSFVDNPVEIEVEDAPKVKEVELLVHPDRKEKRKIKIDKIYIMGRDFDDFNQHEVRLLHLYNINLERGVRDGMARATFTSSENKDIPKINWVSSPVKTRILMDNGKWVQGFADSGIKSLKIGGIIQFERFGFVRLDNIKKDKGEDVYEFWFAHK
jgi:glutamyl-tRNA synthetase